jgi:hypothetical protein
MKHSIKNLRHLAYGMLIGAAILALLAVLMS